MADTFGSSERSRIMAAVKSKDTTPELVVRRLVRLLRYRFRLHVGSMPGSPDMVLPWRRAVIFVHGCFWHGHYCQAKRRNPVTNAAYWRNKRARNQSRDRRVRSALRRQGWRVLVVWECQTKTGRVEALERRLRRLLAGGAARNSGVVAVKRARASSKSRTVQRPCRPRTRKRTRRT